MAWMSDLVTEVARVGFVSSAKSANSTRSRPGISFCIESPFRKSIDRFQRESLQPKAEPGRVFEPAGAPLQPMIQRVQFLIPPGSAVASLIKLATGFQVPFETGHQSGPVVCDQGVDVGTIDP